MKRLFRSKTVKAIGWLAFLLSGAFLFLYGGAETLPPDGPAVGENVVFDRRYQEAASASSLRIHQLMRRLKLPAVSVAVGVAGRVAWAEGVGYADLARHEPIELATKYRMGSVSKAITSLAVGMLYECGKLDLDAPIQQYVSYFPEKGYPFTTRQLAGHSAGIRHYTWSFDQFPPHETFSKRHYSSVQEALTIFQDDPLLFEPGTQFHYSTYGYSLLSAALEGASGQGFLSFMQEEIWDPLGMDDTSAEFLNRPADNRASFYLPVVGRYMEAPTVDNSNKWAGGGLLSTPIDLAKMGNALLSHRVLKAETVDLLFTPQQLASGEVNPQNYGIGWRHGTASFVDDDGRETSFDVVHHGGTAGGASAFLLLFPEPQVVVAMATNVVLPSNGDFRREAYAIAKEFLF